MLWFFLSCRRQAFLCRPLRSTCTVATIYKGFYVHTLVSCYSLSCFELKKLHYTCQSEGMENMPLLKTSSNNIWRSFVYVILHLCHYFLRLLRGRETLMSVWDGAWITLDVAWLMARLPLFAAILSSPMAFSRRRRFINMAIAQMECCCLHNARARRYQARKKTP